jgi:hypothetical protein
MWFILTNLKSVVHVFTEICTIDRNNPLYKGVVVVVIAW